MQITTEFQKIMISFYKNSLVSALIEMTASMMTAVIINCIGGVKALHEALKICFRGHKKKVEMIIHQDITVNLYVVKLGIAGKNLQKSNSVLVVAEDVFSFISPAGYMIPGTRIFYTKWPNHISTISVLCALVNS